MKKLAALVLVVLSCGGPGTPNAPTGSRGDGAMPADGPVPSLRTGALQITDHPQPIAGTVARTSVDRGIETLEVTFERHDGEGYVAVNGAYPISVPGSAAYSFIDRSGGMSDDTSKAWIRRPASAAGTPLTFDLYALSSTGEGGGALLHVRATDPAAAKSDPAVLLDFEAALRDRISESTSGRARRGAWQSFAYARLSELHDADKPPAPPPLAPPPPPPPPKVKPATKPQKPPRGARPVPATAPPPPPPPQPARPAPAVAPAPVAVRPQSTGELAGLMETSTGALAVQEALQADRPLFLGAAREKPTLPIASLTRPKLAVHPWDRMSKSLGVAPPKEPLAEATPAEFWFVRAASYDALTMLLDQADTWGTPASHALDRDPLDHALSARYEAELGIERGPLSRVLGSKVVSELAITGSDPYVREGTDITIIFRVKDRALFGAALGAAVQNHARTHGAVTTSQVSLGGVNVAVARSQDGTVRQHRASLGDLEIVSNSAAGLTRVLLAAQGKHARLSDEPDFQYMLARDKATPSDVLAYMGDRFVAEVTGPAQKIGEARRQLALGELLTPGFASLLYGYLYGKSPTSVDDMVAAKIFARSELMHAAGEPISWKPGETARSRFGTPAELLPLIDVGAVDTVTESEKQSYERFARGYENDWGTYIDPIALRIAAKKVSDHTELSVDLRELPLIDGSGYNSIQREAGDTRFDAAPLASGARVILALGEDSRLRRELSASKSLFGRRDVQFDWVGDFGSIGVLDRAALAQCILTLGKYMHVSQMPEGKAKRLRDADYIAALAKLPIYAEIGVKNPVGATLALAALRSIAEDSAPGLVRFGQAKAYRDVQIVRISVDSEKAKSEFKADVDVNVYYALTKGALVIALSEMAIHSIIDARLDGKAPVPAASGGGSQLSVEASSERGRALWTSLAWIAEGELLDRDDGASAAMAEALLRGAPEAASDATRVRSLAFAYFGAAPLTPDGGAYTLGPDGLRDPVRGSLFAPAWPNLPVPGSPIDALLSAITHARADLSFDEEGKDTAGQAIKSLHAHVTTVLH